MAVTIEHYKFVSSSEARVPEEHKWTIAVGRQCRSYLYCGKVLFRVDTRDVPIEFITGYCKMVVVSRHNVSVGIDGLAARLRPPIVFGTVLKLI